MNVIAVVNQKGGVGKTTTTVNLAHAVVMLGHSVSVVDLDPQGHLSACLGQAGNNARGLSDMLLEDEDIAQYCIEARSGLRLLSSGPALKQLESGGREPVSLTAFRENMKTLFGDQEYVFIDCPPASGILIDYALSAADRVLVPVAADYLALRGLSELVMTLRDYSEKRQDAIAQSIVLTRFHGRRRLCHEVRDKLVEYFPGRVLATPVRETAALAEAPGFGKTVFEYRKHDNGAQDYLNLAQDFIQARYM